MGRRFHLIALLFFAGVGGYWYIFGDHSAVPTPVPEARETVEQPPAVSRAEIQRQFDVLEKDMKANLAKLKPEVAKLGERELAEARKYQVREQQQLARQPFWSKVLSTNWLAYKKLHTEALSSAAGAVPCTICNGRGQLDDCILCDGTGKCPTCGGTGYLASGELCPSCLGSKHCYLCSGTGKMTCPFCDDGMVYAKADPPPNQLPIYCQAPSSAMPVASAAPRNTDTSVLPPEVLAATQASGQNFAPAPIVTPVQLMFVAVLVLSMLLAVWQIVQQLNLRREKLISRARQAEEDALREKRIFEDPTMKSFYNELQFGLNAAPTEFVPDALAALRTMQNQVSETKLDLATASQEFFESATANFIWLRSCLSEVNRRPDESFRRRLLLEFSEQVRPAKVACLVPALRSYWLLAFALEGFVRQLARKPSELNLSALRTVEGALGMLEVLCVSGLRADLASEPPIRLLAVDDNAVCLRSMSLALTKVFPEPDLAPEGKTALAKVEQHVYDVIFLDIDMPGMDGFEVCTKIRESKLNKNTPVVFVTRHSDFNSRAKSDLVGAQDLIGKPYHPTEITVKALLMALRGRLAADTGNAEPAAEEAAALERPEEIPA
jgi:CheY-like chemotaxis protein